MKCDNCGKNNANVRYLRNINGIKQEMNLCEECSRKMGITDIGFNMPIDFSSFLGGFFEDFQNSDLLSLVEPRNKLRCNGCNYTFEDIINTGRFGCPECYDTFEAEIDNILNKLHGSNRHKGRIGNVEKVKVDLVKANDDLETNNKSELEQLQEKLKELIKEENYEEAAIVRDRIKELENKK